MNFYKIENLIEVTTEHFEKCCEGKKNIILHINIGRNIVVEVESIITSFEKNNNNFQINFVTNILKYRLIILISFIIPVIAVFYIYNSYFSIIPFIIIYLRLSRIKNEKIEEMILTHIKNNP